MTHLLALVGASEIPPVSVVLFIIGAGIWIIGMLYGWLREPWAWERGFGWGLMLFSIGLRVIFGI